MESSEQTTEAAERKTQMRDEPEKPPPSTAEFQAAKHDRVAPHEQSTLSKSPRPVIRRKPLPEAAKVVDVAVVPKTEAAQPHAELAAGLAMHEFSRKLPVDLPVYSEDQLRVLSDIEEIAAFLRDDKEGLPVTDPIENGSVTATSRRWQVIDLYYAAIRKADLQLLDTLIHRGIVSTESINEKNDTPLIAAVRACKANVVRYLLDAGANIDAFGVSKQTRLGIERRGCKLEDVYEYTERTPLQFAAELGNLTIVKLLMEHGADDSLVAPDGQLALRLAAINGHREIVDYLPRRRGGGLKRWKIKHAKAMGRCKRATHGTYMFGKILFYYIPVAMFVIVRESLVSRAVKWLKLHRAEIPSRIARAFGKIPKATRKFPKKALKFLEECAKSVWTLMKRLPNASKIALAWLWTGIKKTGIASSNIFTPKTTKKWLYSFGKMSYNVLGKMSGCIGRLIWTILMGTFRALMYVPDRLCEILAACGGSLRTGGKEILVWCDPKRA